MEWCRFERQFHILRRLLLPHESGEAGADEEDGVVEVSAWPRRLPLFDFVVPTKVGLYGAVAPVTAVFTCKKSGSSTL